MSKLVVETVNKKTTGKIQDVVFLYVKLQSGATKYQSKEIEYTVDLAVDKATSKEFKKAYPKNSCKEFDNAEFVEKFKIDPPFPSQDEQFVIKIKASAHLKADAPAANLKAGDLIPYEWNSRPKVFVPVDGGVEDITLSVLVANGSKGDVAFSVNSNDFGTFPQLTGILVKELIEYEATGGASTPFGTVVGGLKPDTSKVKQVAAPAEQEEEIQEDDDIPF